MSTSQSALLDSREAEQPFLDAAWLPYLYAAMIAGGIVVYEMIRRAGSALSAPAATAGVHSMIAASAAAGYAAHVPTLVVAIRLLVALGSIIVCSRAAGAICARVHQPPVIGEMLAGVLLGPSLLGRVSPGAMSALFPSFVVGPIGMVSQVGVALFMFLVGLELNGAAIRGRAKSALVISHASVVVPFLLGAALSLYLYPLLSGPDVSFTALSLFIGVSMSVTAFPVLARILSDRRMERSRIGTMALTCAAVDDVTAWCLLAFVVGVVHSQVGKSASIVGLTALYLATMAILVRPALRLLAARFENGGAERAVILGVIAVGLLASCTATERIGIHTIFGAFVFGALVPHDSRIAETIHSSLHGFVVTALLPAFFALMGLRTQIGLVSGPLWITCGIIVLTAFAGKLGGTTLAARLVGQTWGDSVVLGILMNTRGLMELIVLGIGLDLGVISPQLFAMLVIMAIVTTFATGPLLRLAESRRSI